jgi:hypothetical protein
MFGGKKMKKVILQILFVAIVSMAGFIPVGAQKMPLEAKIYLLKTGADNANYSSGLFAVKRQVDRRAPLRSALEILTNGPTTDEEARQNLASSTFGIKLVSVRIKNKTAYANFTMPEEARFPGDSAPFIFTDAVKKTALQVAGVKRVVVCLDGILNFGSESEDPPKRCW